MPKVFISYRRSDSADVTGRIYDHLAAQFGRENVFEGIDAIPVGVNFIERIRDAVESCDFVLAIIGNSWTEVTDDFGERRLDDPKDVVRRELEVGLESDGVSVIPVLVQDAQAPDEHQLPDSLKPLMEVNAAPVRSGRDFDNDVAVLIETMAPHDKNRKLRLGVALSVVVASLFIIGALWTYQMGRNLTTVMPQQSIAVLPFDNTSDDAGNEYFSDGISEELMNQLAGLSGLRVAARKSSFYFKDRDEPVQQIANQLKVRHILDGSIRKAGNQIRITAQLIDPETGFHLWSQTYDRMLGDIFNIQEEIAIAIAQQLKITLLNPSGAQAEPYRARNPDAYEQYLLGEFHRNKRSSKGLEKALAHYQKAIALDDKFSPAFDSLAYTYLISAYFGNRSHKDAIDLAQPYIDVAFRLTPKLAEVHTTRGLVEHMRGRYLLADRHFADAIELKPNLFNAHNNLGLNLVFQSRLKEASAAYIRAHVLDPLNDSVNFNFGALWMLMGRFDEGKRFLEKAVEINPDRPDVEQVIADWSGNYGHFVEAVEWSNKAVIKNPDNVRTHRSRSFVLTSLGLWDQARESIDRAKALSPDALFVKENEANLLLQTGDRDGFYRFAAQEIKQLLDDPIEPINRIDRFRLHWYGVAQLLRGNNQDAIDYLLRAIGGPEGVYSTTYDDMEIPKLLAIAYQRQGRVDEARDILQHCLTLVSDARENGWATPQLPQRLAEIYAMLGDREMALVELSASVEQGWREAGTLEHSVFLQPLQDHPEFLRIKAVVDEDLNLQRQRIMQLGLISH